MTSPLLDAAALLQLALDAERTVTSEACICTRTSLDGWESQPLSLADEQFSEVGTLFQAEPEPTFAEYLPRNLRYTSPDAPIAPRYFPYNRCGVWTCVTCGRLYLRYTEGGGYFVDKRIRMLKSSLIEDIPL
jgi:hypothetical protein